MSRSLVVAVLSLCMLAPVAARGADLEPSNGYDWSGPYVGAHLGYLWSNSRVSDAGVVVESNAPADGVIGGLLMGYNFQDDSLVYGIEADFGLSNAKGHGVAAVVVPNRYDLNWDGHLRARFGVAPDQGPLLLYMGLGVAIADFKFTEGGTGFSKSDIHVAPSVGVGAEYGFSDSMTGRLEFIYDDYKLGSGMTVLLPDYRVKLKNVATVRVGFDVKF
jgi:outer membrane immunogenic protein